MRRKIIILLAILGALVLGGAGAWPRLSFYMLTGRFTPIEKVEALQNSIAVTTWNADGLTLVNGRTVTLPGLRSLPSESAALTEVTKRGVEVGADGHVWGLVRIHHWCGNDPVRKHIAKIDLAEMMTFLRIGEPTAPVPEADFLVNDPGGTFTEFGWRIGEFYQFQSWEKIKDGER